MYVVSACLAGINCKYNGKNNRNEQVIRFMASNRCVLVCPETEGGLSAPREPAERVGEKILDRQGRELTPAFRKGAERSLKKAEKAAAKAEEQLEGAILKANSPSCGAGEIYDGTFSGKRIAGDGCFTELLKHKHRGLVVITEKEIDNDD